MPIYLWSNQGIYMLWTCASRTLHIYWWLSDYYSIEKTILPPSGHALVDLVNLVLGQDVASLLSLCMTKWLRKWRRGWLYVRSNTKKLKVSDMCKTFAHICCIWTLYNVYVCLFYISLFCSSKKMLMWYFKIFPLSKYKSYNCLVSFTFKNHIHATIWKLPSWHWLIIDWRYIL